MASCREFWCASIDLVEEVDEFFKIYFVVRFGPCNLDHSYKATQLYKG